MTQESEAAEQILDGNVMIYINGLLISVGMKDFKSRAIMESTEENVLQGPKDGLSENINVSINLKRNRYKENRCVRRATPQAVSQKSS